MGPHEFVLARDPEGKAWYVDHAVSPAIFHLIPGCHLGWEHIAAPSGMRISVAHFKAILQILNILLWMVPTFISECQRMHQYWMFNLWNLFVATLSFSVVLLTSDRSPGQHGFAAVAPGPGCQCEYITCNAHGLCWIDRHRVKTTYSPPSSPQLDRSINLNLSLVLAAAVTDVSCFITVSQRGFDGRGA